jgi:apolipoprotein N-acyltransferase
VAALGVAAVLLGLTVGYGAVRLRSMNDAEGPFVRVALVQGNVPNPWRVDAARAEDAFRAFADATRSVVPLHPDLVVWPENAVSFLLAPNPRFGRAAADILGSGGPGLLLGGPRYVADGDGHVRFFNSAYLLAANGEPVMVYDKRHLVPFAEYAPLPRVPWLGWRFDAPGDYTPGVVPTIFPDPAPFGVLICFEAIYPELARDLVRQGARFLLNLSNDAWFGSSAGLEQHLAMAVFRAVETRRGLARATNTGVTALVAPSGRIQARFPTGVRGAWVVQVPLRDGLSFYVRVGDLFAWFTTLGALVALATAGRPR